MSKLEPSNDCTCATHYSWPFWPNQAREFLAKSAREFLPSFVERLHTYIRKTPALVYLYQLFDIFAAFH